jgi:hypothetical protein
MSPMRHGLGRLERSLRRILGRSLCGLKCAAMVLASGGTTPV